MAGEERVTKLKIDNVKKIYQTRKGEMTALNGVNLDIKENEFICVVGPSGCGKSTLLNIIAGLDTPTSGAVYIDGKKIEGTGTERGVVFQQYALFPWLTVLKNVMFGLKLQGKSDAEAKEIAMKYIKMVQLEDFVNHYPKELSGGMKQRVAIARAYAVKPEVLLMDEPFGALDAQTRTQLQTELLKTWESERKTCFFITHDVDEAIILAQRVIVMSARPGRIKDIVNFFVFEQTIRMDTRTCYIEIFSDKRRSGRQLVADFLLIIFGHLCNHCRVHAVKSSPKLCIFKNHRLQRCVSGTLADTKQRTVNTTGTIKPCRRGIDNGLIEIIMSVPFDQT